MRKPRTAWAQNKAKRLLAAHGIKSVDGVPVDRLARELGAEIRDLKPGGKILGCLIHDKGKIIIGVSPDVSPEKRRFAIAHEIGHLVLHSARPLFIDYKRTAKHRHCAGIAHEQSTEQLEEEKR